MDRYNLFQSLIEVIAKTYETEADPMGPYTANAIKCSSPLVKLDEILHSPHDAGIRSVLKNSDHPAAQIILSLHNYLPWGSNPVENRTEQSVAALISVATLSSPEGLIVTPDVRLGLVYMQPHSYYPLHLHNADETYVIVAGQALWTAGTDIQIRRVGDMIHHPGLMPHAFRTSADGFLALWRWSGDINPESYAFIEDSAVEL